MNREVIKRVIKTCSPVVLGYIPAGFAFGLMISSAGFSLMTAIIMSLVIYTGAGQYLAVGFFTDNVSLLQMAIATFLINSKHLFYGISFIQEFKEMGKRRLYMIFSLTDETYAVLNGAKLEDKSTGMTKDKSDFMFLTAIVDHIAWIVGSTLGAGLGSVFDFNTKGVDFAMTALFIVLLIDQIKNIKTKYPFIIGILSALFAMIFFGKGNMLLGAAAISVVMLIILKEKIMKDEVSKN